MGDQLNLDMVSYWTREKPLLREMQRVMKEYEGFDYEILKVHEELVKAERVWMIGNHEYRVTNYLESHPELIGMLEPEIWLKLEKRKYEVIPFNHAYKLGKLNVIHGWYHNQQHAKKHVFDFERNVVYAHNHTCQEFTKHSPMDVKDFHSATCLPCLCDLNPD
ncbi:MAG: hypothetical protein GWN00_30390, partial [Aliifodinibius sp.]|nr:hypothetical protein [Fodinibius sp.]NIV15098.1 hypothetical protein [Fodinibius sp.]NIY28940.1 hypothetical protein [Fodinibius sp.]